MQCILAQIQDLLSAEEGYQGADYGSQTPKPHLLQPWFQLEHLKWWLQVAPSCFVALETLS